VGNFDLAVAHFLHSEPRCPFCGETNTTAVVGERKDPIELIGLVYFCNTCSKEWAVALPPTIVKT
jgi:transposase-like protein